MIAMPFWLVRFVKCITSCIKRIFSPITAFDITGLIYVYNIGKHFLESFCYGFGENFIVYI